MNNRKFLVIGLDCASPQLVFEDFKNSLPNLTSLIQKSVYGRLRSSTPPITIPAWMVMFTGKSPGKLGLYGFRHRKGNSYTDIWISNPRNIKEPKVWDIISNTGSEICLFAIPPNYPPIRVNGYSVGCFLTPSSKSNYTSPPELKAELEQVAGAYIPDINYRSGDRKDIKKQLFEMLDNHMKMIIHLLKKKKWTFFALNNIGVDRAHHAFWRYHDTTHHMYEANSEFKDVIRDYYKAVDDYIGKLLEIVDEETYILVVSDHGVKPMRGAFCINEWLIQEGYLVLNKYPETPVPLSKADVNWKKTKAWAWGGYYSRVFLNIKGRENEGLISPDDYEKELSVLEEKLGQINDNHGKRMDNLIIRPEEFYENPIGDYPDLMVIFDDLYWRAAGTIGHHTTYLLENDIGSDDAMHDWNGLYILYDPKQEHNTGQQDANIEDIAPTILHLLNEQIPKNLDGKVIQNYL